ncbi:DNA-3-methyladenine glycosylase I [Balneola sp. MJW-20]|uniref:DNA-3-methyladenine glycosylase I n=1 Tax=Gracilimonas aurantiaca TaxID=3234185 RepID=UPI00346540EB
MNPISRCEWADGQSESYVAYHDMEWGVPVHDDKVHFEFITLEGAQAGLSWATVLKKRDHYRRLFAGFDPEIVAGFTSETIERLLQDPGIIRNRLKVESTVTNAQAFLKVQEQYGSFDNYIWSFTGQKVLVNHPASIKDLPASTQLSDQISKDLKKRGFRFVGSTIIYAYLQACGIVNDHTIDCFRYEELT